MIELIFFTVICMALFMSAVWLVYVRLRNPGIIDAVWAIAITIAGLVFLTHTIMPNIQMVFMLLLLLWCGRLSGYLFITRILPGHIEQRYGAFGLWGFWLNYQMQGILAIIMATPFLYISQLTDFSAFSGLSMLLILFGIVGESIADLQLQRFRTRHKGEVCNVGLWRFSRHPNYFFEWVVWLGFASAALTVAYGWLSLVSPIMLLYIMLKITGPITEANSVKHRGKKYEDYQAKTSVFFPWPSKDS